MLHDNDTLRPLAAAAPRAFPQRPQRPRAKAGVATSPAMRRWRGPDANQIVAEFLATSAHQEALALLAGYLENRELGGFLRRLVACVPPIPEGDRAPRR